MPRRLLMLVLLLAVQTGCPHAFGRGGTIDMAVRKDMDQSWRQHCWLSDDVWLAACGDDYWDRTDEERAHSNCPPACRPPPRK